VELHEFDSVYRSKFADCLQAGVAEKRYAEDLLDFDLDVISAALQPERDQKFMYLGLQIIYDRYLVHIGGRRIETPQYFWMRVAMGLAINEGDAKNERAIEFYNMISSFRFVSSTPTLFNSGTCHPQLSSCYLLTVQDDLEDIFKIISDDARLSKWAGGLGNDWTNVRATGAHIKGTNGTSQGVIPFLKVANDTAVAVNQGGKRKGALCSYLESWHIDVEDFLELRKNTGDERRRTHDMHTANWIPDLFMKRVRANAEWTLFSPNECPDLHNLVGSAFEARYEEYEAMADRGEIHTFRRVEAPHLWRKMITMLFETGHPWITFKDPSNVRSPQDHKGVVHSSNLCTEILLNTSKDESAVCNLGSVNLVEHIKENELDEKKIQETVSVALRMLDNVIDINFYPIPETRRSNMQHRPVGLGIMGFQDALHVLDISYASHEGVTFADHSMELVSYYAILSSAELASERGHYPSYGGSKWNRGLLPIDTIDLLEKERGGYLKVDRSMTKDWDVVRRAVAQNGMRNCNCMAIAPTATIANIVGVSQSIEPAYKHLYVKSNLSGDFTVVNPHLVDDLKAQDLWDQEMIDDLKYFDGSISEIERVPEAIRHKYITAFEMDSSWLIDAGSRRQKWIDMGQSLNLYCAEPSGKKLSDMYFHAWESGLKTTYYLRSLSATQVEKSTLDVNKRGVQPRWMKNKSASSNIEINRDLETPIPPRQCSIDDPDCESCQ
jgi:ribonucleoside-diphosphate reductase alpha chain